MNFCSLKRFWRYGDTYVYLDKTHIYVQSLKHLESSEKNFQIYKLDLEKAEEPEIKLPTSAGSQKKQENSRKTSTSALLIMLKPFCGSQKNVENSSRHGNTRPPDLPLEKSVSRSRSNS